MKQSLWNDSCNLGEVCLSGAECRRDRDRYILIVAMHAAADAVSVGAISVPAYRGQRRHGDMRDLGLAEELAI